MSYDLESLRSGEEFSFSLFVWPRLLGLAKRYGWKPEGTLAPLGWPENKPWTGRYDWNDGAVVTQSDARALATAVEHLLLDLPDEDCYPDGIPLCDLKWDRASVVAVLSGREMKDRLGEFVALCQRSGGFAIR